MEKAGFNTKLIRFSQKIPSLLWMVIIYALLNGIIYAGQEIYYYGDSQKMKQLKSEMGGIKTEITRLESYARDDSLPEPQYSQYNNKIDEYNKKVNEYNELNKKSGSRWWLIPIPIGHGNVTPK